MITGLLPIISDYQSRASDIFKMLDVSEATRKDYTYRIKLFLDFIRRNSFHVNSYLEFKRYLGSRNDYSVSTKNKYLAAARIFLKELNRQGILPRDITQNIKVFQQSKKHKKDGLNDKEISQLIEKMHQLPATPRNARLKAMLSLLVLQGLRQIELCRLDVKDLDFTNSSALIHGKGMDDTEPIPLQPETAKALKEYLRLNKISDGALFVSQSNHGRNKRLTTKSVREIIKGVFIDLKIEKTVHGTRHFFVTKLIENYNGDLLDVARYSRHKTLEMLQVYQDRAAEKEDLPRFYKTFDQINFA